MNPQTHSNHVRQTRKGPNSGRSADSGNRPGFRAHSRTAVNWHVVIGWGIGPAIWLLIALVLFLIFN